MNGWMDVVDGAWPIEMHSLAQKTAMLCNNGVCVPTLTSGCTDY